MNRIKVMGLCLVAVFALAAVAASSASANPGWYECGKATKTGKTYNGHYTAKTCGAASKVETGGKYELVPGVGKGKGFKGADVGGATLRTTTPLGITAEVKCTGAKDSGKTALPNKEYDVVAEYSGCESGGNKCSSEGVKKAGTIKTNPLSGELVNVSPLVGGGVAVELGAEAGPEAPQVSFSCKVVKAAVYGHILGIHTSAAAEGVSKESFTTYTVNKYLGVVKAEGYEWEPITNQPLIEGKEAEPVYLSTGLCGEEVELLLKKECAAPIPSGQEQTVKTKGENLIVQ